MALWRARYIFCKNVSALNTKFSFHVPQKVKLAQQFQHGCLNLPVACRSGSDPCHDNNVAALAEPVLVKTVSLSDASAHQIACYSLTNFGSNGYAQAVKSVAVLFGINSQKG